MKVKITQPGSMRFSDARVGMLFKHGDGIYVKSESNTAVAVYKSAGMMNAGADVDFDDDIQVVRVAEVEFILG